MAHCLRPRRRRLPPTRRVPRRNPARRSPNRRRCRPPGGHRSGSASRQANWSRRPVRLSQRRVPLRTPCRQWQRRSTPPCAPLPAPRAQGQEPCAVHAQAGEGLAARIDDHKTLRYARRNGACGSGSHGFQGAVMREADGLSKHRHGNCPSLLWHLLQELRCFRARRRDNRSR